MHVINLTRCGFKAMAAIVGAGILATEASTGAEVIFCKVMDRKRGCRLIPNFNS